jgi:uncharacterized protein YgbK (DUF1537 family)
MSTNNLLMAFYGDDFTGSTDALECLSRAGARTALFIAPPAAEQLAAYPGLDAIGVAGMTRSMDPAAMESVLHQAFTQLRDLGARHIHYKVCSTFDSSPVTGSIGKAIDVGMDVFANTFIPLLVAAPSLGRYCVFGNLFAQMGIGSNGNVYRLDRHPSMSKHPVTPADESDLRLHLSKQTDKKIGLLDILQLSKPKNEFRDAFHALLAERSQIILIDALYEEQLLLIGELIDACAQFSSPLFSAGSSGVEMALGKYWNEKQVLQPVTAWPHPRKAAPLLVISGSCSPVTAGQITWALSNGFKEVIFDANVLAHGGKMAAINACTARVIALLQEQTSVIVHTNGAFMVAGERTAIVDAALLGFTLGAIASDAVAATGIKRICIAGGDTSGYAARAMGIEAVEMIAPIVTGAPLCKASAPKLPVDGKEINFKGGQVGGENYFGVLLEGGF